VLTVGIAGVVGVLVSVGGLASSLRQTMNATGRADRAIVLRDGADSEANSSLPIQAAKTIMDAPGIARGQSGMAAASADVLVSVHLPRTRNRSRAGLAVRGVGPEAFVVRPGINLVEGRMFQAGLHEVIVGRRTQREFLSVQIGDHIDLRDGPWEVVGVFTSDNAYESGFITDSDSLRSANKRETINSVTVALESPESFAALKAALLADPTLPVDVQRESDYYARQSETLSRLVSVVTNVVVTIMAIGALFAALNSMYSAVSERGVEIATLRAIGFGPTSVVVSVLFEALLLAVIGAAIGAAAAYLFFSGSTVSMGSTLAATVFEWNITPEILISAITWACAVGLLGGLFPALRAARIPVAAALRDT
jgi:putative ABC transport system permease protein